MLFGFGKRAAEKEIGFRNQNRDLVLYRYGTNKQDLPLLAGSRIRVREHQYIVFMSGGEVADVWDSGLYLLTEAYFPILAERISFSDRPLKAELYFLNTAPVTEHKWATRTPALLQDERGMHQVRAYGTYDFRIRDSILFMMEAFIRRGLKDTAELASFLLTLVAGAFSSTLSDLRMPVTEVINHAWQLSDPVRRRADRLAAEMGLEILNVNIEGASLPDTR